MDTSLGNANVGLGPMPLETSYMVANQRKVINDVVDRIALACDTLAKRQNIPDPTQSFTPHHVISIVGGRGTGKTSVLLTIAEQLKEKIERAFVVDIINPDQLSSKFPVSAVVVYAIERALKKQNLWHKIEEKLDENDHKFRPMSWAVQIPETFEVLSRDTINTREWHEQLFKLLVAPVDLVSDFHAWLSCVLKAIDHEICVIAIDDADISVEKAEEIIEAIRIYLASPNIVTLLAIDLPSLERKLRNSRLAKLPNLPEYKEEKDESLSFLFGMSRGAYQSSEAQAEQEYVENLLAKVLPQAMRYYLTGLSDHEKLYTLFQIPGKYPSKSLSDILEETDRRSPRDSGIDLAPLIRKHPDILSNNVRQYSNQFVVISDACSQYLAQLSSVSDKDKETLMTGYTGSSIQIGVDSEGTTNLGRGIGQLNPIKTDDQLIRSQFQMKVLRSFLVGSEFVSLQSKIIQVLGIDITQFSTAHEFATFLLRRGVFRGTYNSKLTYRILGKNLESRMSNALMNLCIDWVLANGSKMEYVVDIMNASIIETSFPAVQVPKRLTRYLSQVGLSHLESNANVVRKAFEDYVGVQVVVPVDRDRLMPGFIQNSSGLGRYIDKVTNYERLERQSKHAQRFVTLIDKAKKDELQENNLREAIYRILGLLAIQTIYHLDNLETELVFDGNLERSAIDSQVRYSGSDDSSWIIIEIKGVLEFLHQIMIRSSLSLSQKLLALSYVADLPMTTLLGCLVGSDLSGKRDKLLESIQQIFDQLTNLGFVTERTLGSSSIGRLNPSSSDEAAGIYHELSKHYPSFDWTRRWQAMDILINKTLKNVTFQSEWESRKQPPVLWANWASEILANFSIEDFKKISEDKDENKEDTED